MDIEIKGAIDALGSAFHEFKAKNDQRLAEVEKKGHADPLLTEQVEKINKHLGELDALKGRLDEMEKRGNRPGVTASEQAVSEHKAAFSTFLRKGREDGLSDLQAKAVSVGVVADGGYAVPTELDTEIAQIERKNSPMRGVARVITVSSEKYEKLVNQGGAASGWVGETDARPVTNTPKLAKVPPFFGELYANPAATQQSLEDIAFNVEAWLAEEVGIEFAEQENAAFTSGDGVKKPKGILAYTLVAGAPGADGTRAFGQIQKRHSGAAGTFTADSLISLVHDLKRGYRTGASFMMSNITLSKARMLKGSDEHYIWRPGLEEGVPSTLLGYGVEENDDMPDAAASANAIIFANFQRGYYVVDVRGTTVLRDPYTNKPYVHFYTTKRVGGMVVDDRAIKVLTLAV